MLIFYSPHAENENGTVVKSNRLNEIVKTLQKKTSSDQTEDVKTVNLTMNRNLIKEWKWQGKFES